MKKILSYMKGREWVFFVAFIGFVIGQTMLTLTMPEYMDEITRTIQAQGSDLNALVRPAAFMLLCAAGSIVCAIFAAYFVASITTSVTGRMREAIFRKTISFSLAEMNGFSTSSLITRCTNDVDNIQNFSAMGLQALIQGPLMAVIAIIKMGSNSTWLFAVMITIVLILAMLLAVFFISLPKNVRLQGLVDKLNRVTREHLSGLRVVHAYNGYDFQKKQFDEVNEEATGTNIFVNRTMGILSPFLPFFMNGLSLVIYVLGAVMITNAAGPEKLDLFSQMIVFESYALQAVSAFVIMLMAIVALPTVVVSIRRINEVLNTKLTIEDGAGAAGTGVEGRIEFRHVSFAYPGASEKVLSDISFTAEKGQVVAIIGSTGSGKTSLMNLIPRLYDATEGEVLVDGVNVRDYKIEALREKIGYVPQKSFLFEGTISSNIDYGKGEGFASAVSEIKKAAEIGQSKEFIEKKEGAYDAHVEEGGSNFSGGQKQRLTISRAVCRNPEFYLFDDSFSALDFKTDAVLRKKLHEYAKDATQIIVGQRIGSIMHADQILVLEKGRVVGIGTHEELMKTCAVYQEIAASQLSQEDIA